MAIQPENVLDFWFGPTGSAVEIAGQQSKLWFGKSPANDQAIIEAFTATLADAATGRLDFWAGTPRGRLALGIVLDQFPHHIYRDRPQAFSSEKCRYSPEAAGLIDCALKIYPVKRNWRNPGVTDSILLVRFAFYGK